MCGLSKMHLQAGWKEWQLREGGHGTGVKPVPKGGQTGCLEIFSYGLHSSGQKEGKMNVIIPEHLPASSRPFTTKKKCMECSQLWKAPACHLITPRQNKSLTKDSRGQPWLPNQRWFGCPHPSLPPTKLGQAGHRMLPRRVCNHTFSSLLWAQQSPNLW